MIEYVILWLMYYRHLLKEKSFIVIEFGFVRVRTV